MTSRRTQGRGRRHANHIVLAGLLVAISTAAIAIEAWQGHRSRELTFDQSVAIARDKNVPDERRRSATANLRIFMLRSIDELKALAKEDGPAGVEARSALDHATTKLRR